jgi:uncharacterized protein (DUF608 family)
LITWHLPNLVNYWNGNRGIFSESVVAGKRLGNYCTTRIGDAWDVARHVAANLPALLERTQAFHDALFSSTLPAPVLDAVSANMSIIRTTTSLRTEDGAFHAFEGSGDTEGSCPMDCTHVWNYEQALAHLFPDGAMAFRSLLPLGLARWDVKPAADGQMGSMPHGGRPMLPFPYADEAWTGVEYAVAAHCIQMGLVEEGLEIVRGVRSRHDGQRRNPWNEVECGTTMRAP